MAVSLVAIADPGLRLAAPDDAAGHDQLVARERDVDVEVAAPVRIVDRPPPLPRPVLAPALEQLQADDRTGAQARIAVGPIGLRAPLRIVGLADPHDLAAHTLGGRRAVDDLDAALLALRPPGAVDPRLLGHGGGDR